MVFGSCLFVFGCVCVGVKEDGELIVWDLEMWGLGGLFGIGVILVFYVFNVL